MTPVAERLEKVLARIAAACRRVDRDPAEVTLVGASKSQPVETVRAAWEAGLAVFGENRVQEAQGKSSVLPAEIDWHLIGHLQSNKVRPAARLFSTVHSVDRPKIARGLDREAAQLGKRLLGLVEVNLGGEDSKHGFAVDGLAEAVRPLAELEHLEMVGMMAVPPFEADLGRARDWFRRLRELRDDLFALTPWSGRPGWLSMGMSHDYEIAVEEGATHVRVGTALFGPRG